MSPFLDHNNGTLSVIKFATKSFLDLYLCYKVTGNTTPAFFVIVVEINIISSHTIGIKLIHT